MKHETDLTAEPTLPDADTANAPATEPMTDDMADQPAPQPADTQPETAGQPSPSPTPDELAAMLAEAEQRGYLRGRNEQITLAMKAPALWQEPDNAAGQHDEFQPAILANLRPSIWD